jgi:hypothetical protein
MLDGGHEKRARITRRAAGVAGPGVVQIPHQARHGFDGEGRRNISRGVAAHSISDEEETEVAPHGEGILVGFTPQTNVGPARRLNSSPL